MPGNICQQGGGIQVSSYRGLLPAKFPFLPQVYSTSLNILSKYSFSK
jgi:hypothetical protein